MHFIKGSLGDIPGSCKQVGNNWYSFTNWRRVLWTTDR